jgi:hypothetical protein
MTRVVVACWFLIASFACVAAETIPSQGSVISKVYLDSEQNIRIVYSDGKEFRPPREEDQVACESFAVAEDKQTAGWLVDYPSPNTTYPIPMTLVIYRSGKVIHKISNGFVIGRWYFLQGGRQVAFATNTLHGDVAPYYELQDILTKKTIDHWQGQVNEKSPEWAKRLSQPN